MIGLDWPDGRPRTPEPERVSTSKFQAGTRQTRRDLKAEMGRVDPDEWALDEANGSNGDPGVVLRWADGGRNYAVACDRYTTKKANLRCIYLWVRETRKRNDRPVVSATGDGFAAAQLPSGDEETTAGDPPAHDVLGVAADAPPNVVKAAARSLKKQYHPDGSDPNERRFKQVVRAEERLLESQPEAGTP